MPVEYVAELFEGRRGQDGIDRHRTYARRFEVRTTDPADDATVAGADPALPRNGDPHPNDAGAFMVSITPEQHPDDYTLWTVTCEYDTEIPKSQAKESQTLNPATGQSEPTPSGTDPTARPENPLNRPPVYKVGHEQSTEIAKYDKNGDPIVNSAGDPFDPPLEIEVSHAVVTVTKNYASIDFDTLENFIDAVNVTAWNGRAARTFRILAIEYEPASENGFNFWRATFRIKYNPETWDRTTVDQGFREYVVGPPETMVVIQGDDKGSFPDKPSLLDGNGRALGAGNAPVFLTFRIYKEKEFSLLGLT